MPARPPGRGCGGGVSAGPPGVVTCRLGPASPHARLYKGRRSRRRSFSLRVCRRRRLAGEGRPRGAGRGRAEGPGRGHRAPVGAWGRRRSGAGEREGRRERKRTAGRWRRLVLLLLLLHPRRAGARRCTSALRWGCPASPRCRGLLDPRGNGVHGSGNGVLGAAPPPPPPGAARPWEGRAGARPVPARPGTGPGACPAESPPHLASPLSPCCSALSPPNPRVPPPQIPGTSTPPGRTERGEPGRKCRHPALGGCGKRGDPPSHPTVFPRQGVDAGVRGDILAGRAVVRKARSGKLWGWHGAVLALSFTLRCTQRALGPGVVSWITGSSNTLLE